MNNTSTIKQLKKGSFFTKKAIENPKDCQVWIRGDYDREMKRYECTRFDDSCTSCYMPASKVVYIDFTF